MALQVITVFLTVVQISCANAAEYKLTSTWAEPSRTRFCPVHAPFKVRAAGSSVELVPPRRGAFSVAEASASFPVGNATTGLRMRLSATGSTMPSFWRVSLHRLDARRRKSVRFIAPVEVPRGGVERTVFMPWTSFLGQQMHVGGMKHCDHSVHELCTFQPEEITHVSVVWARKNGIEEPSLMLHEVVATPSAEVPLQVTQVCSCDVKCVRCMFLSWAPMVSKLCSSSTTSDMCLAVRRSLAERVAAGLGGGSPGSCAGSEAQNAVQWLTSTMDVTSCMGGSPALPARVLGDILEGVFKVNLLESKAPCQAGAENVSYAGDFEGPFEGWGITGHNDLAVFRSETADSCLDKCRAEPRCRSIDYGSRGSVLGQCWLSTKNRLTAASDYASTWDMYDYYEVALAGSVSKDYIVNAGAMARMQITKERRTELLKALDGGVQGSDCCANPDSCMGRAIAAGAPLYNSGDALGCFFIYHAAATRLAGCPARSNVVLPDARGLMQATAKTAEMDTVPNHAAWRLRRAFDAYSVMLRYGKPESLQCKHRALGRLGMKMNMTTAAMPAETKPTVSNDTKPAGSNTTKPAESNTAKPAVSNTQSQQAGKLAGSTTTKPASPTVVKGNIKLGVLMNATEAASFVKDAKVILGVEKGIAKKLNLANMSWVKATLSVVTTRRLGAAADGTANINVDFVITVPATATSAPSASTLEASLQKTDQASKDMWKDTLTTEIKKAAPAHANLKVTVSSIAHTPVTTRSVRDPIAEGIKTSASGAMRSVSGSWLLVIPLSMLTLGAGFDERFR